MCFSATASFISCGVLCTSGFLALKKCEQTEQRLFASIPLVFGTQQFFEGLIWNFLSQTGIASWDGYAVKMFLFFALVLWPIWVPWSVLKIETHPLRKKIIGVTLLMGLVFAFTACAMLFIYPSSASINGYHIDYLLEYPLRNHPLATIFYLAATLLPLLLSSLRYVPYLGLLIFGSYILSYIFYSNYIISVWCFFAAIISGLIYLMVTNKIKVFEPYLKNN